MEPSLEQQIARGKEAYARNDFLAALADLQAAAEREPDFPDVQNLIGICLGLLGRPEAAIHAFDRAVALNPGFVEAHVNRAITLNDLGRLEEARGAFERASAADGSKEGPYAGAVGTRLALGHAGLGDVYAEAGDLPAAAEQYRRACRIRPHFADLRNKLGRTLIEMQQLDEAAAELGAAVADNPTFAGARANLGLAHFRAGKLDDARREWERCAAQHPGDPQVLAYLGMLDRRDEGSVGV